MAHDIFQDRRMFFAGATPWHGLGVKLPAAATWEQARDAAGFYNVVERDVFAAGVTSAHLPESKGVLPDVKALIADDDGRYLSTVGRDYGVVQFSDMARTVIEATGDMATFETGGLLGERGQKGWLLGVVAGEPLMVKGGDEIRRYLLAYSGHDGRTPVTLANCATRAVCANTIASALGEQGGFKRSIRHTSNALTYVEQAKEAFKALINSYARLGKWANLAAERRLTAQEAHAVMAHAYPVPQGEAVKESAKERIEAIHGKIVDLYSAHEIPSTAGTAWAMFNAVQGYAEHFAPTRARLQLSAMTDTARAASIAERSFFGAGADGSAGALAAVLSVTGLPHPAQMAA